MFSYLLLLVHWTSHAKSGAGADAYILSITYASVKPTFQSTKQIYPQKDCEDKLQEANETNLQETCFLHRFVFIEHHSSDLKDCKL